jgi:hypothetical protein
MSLLDDENILIKDIKDSINFMELLSGIYKSFREHHTICIDDVDKLIPKLPQFKDCEWVVYSGTCIKLFHKSRLHSSLCSIDFTCTHNLSSNLFNYSYHYFYSLTLHEFADALQYEKEIIQNLKDLFDLDNKCRWDANYFRSWGAKVNAQYISSDIIEA